MIWIFITIFILICTILVVIGKIVKLDFRASPIPFTGLRRIRKKRKAMLVARKKRATEQGRSGKPTQAEQQEQNNNKGPLPKITSFSQSTPRPSSVLFMNFGGSEESKEGDALKRALR